MGLLWLSKICVVVVGLSKNGIFPEKLKYKFTEVPLIINGILEQKQISIYEHFIHSLKYLDSEQRTSDGVSLGMFVKEVEIVMFSSGHLPDATQDRSQSPQFPSNTSLVASSTLVAHQGCPFCESFLVQVLYITPEYTNGNTHSRNVEIFGLISLKYLGQ